MFSLASLAFDQDTESSDYEDDLPFYRHLERRRALRNSGRNNFEQMILDLAIFLGENDPSINPYLPDDDRYEEQMETEPVAPKAVRSLLDSSAQVAASNCSCDTLESANPPLDEGLLKKVAFWAFPQSAVRVQAFADMTNKSSWETGELIVTQNKIREMWQVGFMATAYITKYNSSEEQSTDIRVSLTFERQRIVSSSCSECRAQVWCQHVIAAIIYRIRFPDKVTVHAPMTETLSTLDRVQLQKLLQYAVQEDPAGILGKVFKHLDEVRDSNSEINKEQGAPDPTFGYQVGKTQWELSLEGFLQSFQNDLDSLCRAYYDSSMYPPTFDLSRKVKSMMFRYLNKTLELTRRGDSLLAVEALAAITQKLFAKMKKVPTESCPSLVTFTHDLIHVYTVLALSHHQDKQTRSQLLKLALEFNENRWPGYTGDNSSWAELPSLVDSCTAETDKLLIGKSGTMFLEPLAALTVNSSCEWPADLLDLIEGRVSVDESTYDEDVRIMLARLDSLVSMKPETGFAQVGRLAAVVLRKLQAMALKLSIIGKYIGSHPFKEVMQEDGTVNQLPKDQAAAAAAGSAAASNSRESSRTRRTGKNKSQPNTECSEADNQGKGKGKRRARSKGKGPAPKKRRTRNGSSTKAQKYEEEEPLLLSKGQLAYSMLYTLRAIMVSQKVTTTVVEKPPILACSMLMALELSRFRTVPDEEDIQTSEHDWLLSLENMVCGYLSKNWSYAKGAVTLLLDAFTKVGMQFYEGNYPLHLLEEFLHICMLNENVKEKRRDDILRVCASVLIDLQHVLKRYKVPNCHLFDSYDLYWNGHSSSGHRYFIPKKLQGIINTFVSNVNETNPNQVQLFIEVLDALRNLISGPVLKIVTKALKSHAIKIWACKPAVVGDPHPMKAAIEVSVRLVLQSLMTNRLNSRMLESDGLSDELSFLSSLIKHLGLEGLKLFVGNWDKAMSCANIATLILQFETDILSSTHLPDVVRELLEEYITSDQMHGSEVCQLVGLLTPEDAKYAYTIDSIMQNAKHFHQSALVALAQQHLKHKCQDEQVMDLETLAIVEKAFESRSRLGSQPLGDFVGWLCRTCTQGLNPKTISKNPVFQKLMEIVGRSATQAPDTLLLVLGNLEKNPHLLKNASPICEKLLEAQKAYFSRRVAQANHSHYAAIINEMYRARMQCKTYIKKKGGEQFDDEVVKPIRARHSGKKKLIRMLNAEFGTPTD